MKDLARVQTFRNQLRLKSKSGFALLELMITLSITAVLAVYANQELANRSQETIARSGGVYLNAVAQAVERHVLLNFNDLVAGNPVAGTAIGLKPALAEMIALGRLRAGFPLGMPTRQVVRIDLLPTGCPGVACQITSLVCTTTPITLGTGVTRFDLAAAMLEEQLGRGGQARLNDGGNIRGAVLNVPNPNGNLEGVVCGSGFVDVGMFQAFVRIQDTRDPDLRGPLTVAGAATFNSSATVTGAATFGGPTTVNNTLGVSGNTTLQGNLTVNGSTTIGPCINMAGGAQGRAAFGCANPNDLPPGYTGGVRSADVVADKNILTSSTPGTFTGANTNYALLTADNGAGVAEIRTSGRSAANRLTPLGSYAPGAACSLADEGSIARNSSALGLVVCEGSMWSAMKTRGIVGQPCSPDGVLGSSATNISLYCQAGFWTLLADRFGRFAITDTYLVYDYSKGLNPVIPVPVCPSGGSPKIYFNPQGVDARTNRTGNFRVDITTSPGNYTVHVDDSVNPGDPYGAATNGYGLLTVGCFYN